MFSKYNITQDVKTSLPAAHPSIQTGSWVKKGLFAQRLFGYFRRHQLEFWVFELVFLPLFLLLALAFFMMTIGLLIEGIFSIV